jgi:hypothetical protein
MFNLAISTGLYASRGGGCQILFVCFTPLVILMVGQAKKYYLTYNKNINTYAGMQ